MSVMDRFGYPGICFLILIENLFPPIPSEIILPFGGFMTTYTNMTVWGVVFCSTVGSILGALLLYRAGAWLTPARLGAFSRTGAGRILGFEEGKVNRAAEWFAKRGRSAVLFGRCVPIVRSLISIPAGMAGVNMSIFVLYTAAGSAVWNLLLVSLGAALGASWRMVQDGISKYSQLTGFLFKGICVGLIIWWMVRRGIKIILKILKIS